MHVNVYAAKTHLSRLIDQVNAGEEIIITRHGRPVARLMPAGEAWPKRRLGTLKDEVWMSDDFDERLPDDLLDLFEGKGKDSRDEDPAG